MISDNLWQVRAIAVTQLGKIGSAAVVKYLAESLHDKSWWVRINAANALKDIGEVGINVLQNVDPEIDRYAYEVSQHVLHNLITVLGE
ncbi:MAG: HEAT repeat domain-containing protein [Coxiellaceae bacterium]|nr:MAG: HEAT repeat domain-containing protein [Coxiellaceae bacterium]